MRGLEGLELRLATLLGPGLGPGWLGPRRLLGLGPRWLLGLRPRLGPLLATLLGVGQWPNKSLLWEPHWLEALVTVDRVDPDGLRTLESPGVLWGLGLLGARGGALWPLSSDGVGPVADTRVWVEVKVAA